MRLKATSITVCLLLLISSLPVKGTENGILGLAGKYIEKKEFYNAITECMRYQHHYPSGTGYSKSLLIMGEAYYRGGNYYNAIDTMAHCHDKYRDTTEGEWALLSIAYIRLISGSPLMAHRTYQEYSYLYPEGKYRNEMTADVCFTKALQYDLDGSLRAAGEYTKEYPDGRHMDNIIRLRKLIHDEINRPRKSVAVSVGGSIIIPGFGHFYTGQYLTGVFTFVTNAALIYLTYDGFRDDNKLRMIVFGLAELTFYQYSLYSAVRNVYIYNNRESFFSAVRLAARKHF